MAIRMRKVTSKDKPKITKEQEDKIIDNLVDKTYGEVSKDSNVESLYSSVNKDQENSVNKEQENSIDLDKIGTSFRTYRELLFDLEDLAKTNKRAKKADKNVTDIIHSSLKLYLQKNEPELYKKYSKHL